MDVDAAKQKAAPPRGSGSFKCYRCGEEGHMARNCPKPAGYKIKATTTSTEESCHDHSKIEGERQGLRQEKGSRLSKLNTSIAHPVCLLSSGRGLKMVSSEGELLWRELDRALASRVVK